MSIHVISATDASRSMSNILNKVHYQGQSFEIKRGREVIAKIVPVMPKKHNMQVSELNEFFKRLPMLDAEDSQVFAEDMKQVRAHAHFEGNPWD